MSIERAETQESHDSIELEQRSVRALTECMTVLSLGGGIYSVTTESGSEYRVDAKKCRCDCADAKHNLEDDEQCKHARRVAFATGERPIPQWCNDDAVDPLLGEHVEGPVQVASDGGVSTANPKGEADKNANKRPSDCLCTDSMREGEPPCWPCYRDGFEEPASTDD